MFSGSPVNFIENLQLKLKLLHECTLLILIFLRIIMSFIVYGKKLYTFLCGICISVLTSSIKYYSQEKCFLIVIWNVIKCEKMSLKLEICCRKLMWNCKWSLKMNTKKRTTDIATERTNTFNCFPMRNLAFSCYWNGSSSIEMQIEMKIDKTSEVHKFVEKKKNLISVIAGFMQITNFSQFMTNKTAWVESNFRTNLNQWKVVHAVLQSDIRFLVS